jgi:membrane-associated phospholipid phosphatase
MRPQAHFSEKINIHFVEGVIRYTYNSFPSGHSTSVFALSLFLVLSFNLRKTGWLFAILAICIGYSRVYLAVHFPIDVYFGSLIGTLTALIIYAWLNKPFQDKFGNKSLLTK